MEKNKINICLIETLNNERMRGMNQIFKIKQFKVKCVILILIIALVTSLNTPITVLAAQGDPIGVAYNLNYELDDPYMNDLDFNYYFRTEGDAFGEYPIPLREGYVFKGWYLKAKISEEDEKLTSETVVVDNSPNGTGLMELYAQWESGGYSILFDTNSNDQITLPDNEKLRSVGANSPIGDLPVLEERHGYTFNGWYTSKTGGTKIDNTYIVTQPGTIYAQWTPHKRTLSFYPGSEGNVDPISMEVYFEQPYGPLPVPTRDDYDFAGWYSSPDGGSLITESTKLDVLEDRTVYAKWTLKKYTLNFELNGGSLAQTSKKIEYYEPYGELPTPTKVGHTFDGWFNEAAGGEKVTADTENPGNTDRTIYARWTAITAPAPKPVPVPAKVAPKPVQYKVTFNGNKGKMKVKVKNKKKKKNVKKYVITKTKNSKIGKLIKPTRKGYKFKGWYTKKKGGKKIKASTKVTKKMTVYARWKKK